MASSEREDCTHHWRHWRPRKPRRQAAECLMFRLLNFGSSIPPLEKKCIPPPISPFHFIASSVGAQFVCLYLIVRDRRRFIEITLITPTSGRGWGASPPQPRQRVLCGPVGQQAQRAHHEAQHRGVGGRRAGGQPILVHPPAAAAAAVGVSDGAGAGVLHTPRPRLRTAKRPAQGEGLGSAGGAGQPAWWAGRGRRAPSLLLTTLGRGPGRGGGPR